LGPLFVSSRPLSIAAFTVTPNAETIARLASDNPA
jgi:hypothetical protein